MVLQLLPASYKGFRFLVRSVATKGGQKTATDEFPGSSSRSIQDLGKMPDNFDVEAIIHGDNYIDDISKFKQILSKGGLGDFIHPSQGTFEVKCTGFTLTETDDDKGIANFSISFSAASDQVQPIASRSNTGAVSQGTESVKEAFADVIEEEYIVDPLLPGNFEDATEQVEEIGVEFVTNSRQFSPNVPGLAKFQRAVNDFVQEAVALVQSPIELASDVIRLFDTFDAIQSSVGNSFRQLTSFFDFGDDDIPNNNDTFSLIQRTDSRDVLRTAIQGMALAEAYREASLAEFETIDEIDAASKQLDAQYRKIKNKIDLPVKLELSLLRDEVRKVFDEQKLTALQVVEIDLPILPAIVQAQNLFGNKAQDNVNGLIEINNIKDTSFIGGRATKALVA